MDVDHDHRPDELAALFPGVDIIPAEGYKRGNSTKIEILRTELRKERLSKEDDNLLILSGTNMLIRGSLNATRSEMPILRKSRY